MSRPVKKLVYGVFYLSLLLLISFGLYGLFLRPAPSCFDKIQNQGEEGVDCGGPCTACAILNLEPLRVLDVKFFGIASGKMVLLADVVNSNSDYGATANYRFAIYDKTGRVVETLSGSESFRPVEEKYIFSADAKTDYKNISRADLVFGSPTWRPAKDFLPSPNLILGGDTKVSLVGSAIQISGAVRNQDPVNIPRLTIIAVLADKFGRPIFASQTLLSNLAGGEEERFVVSFPADADLNSRFDSENVKILFSGQ